MNDQSKPQAKTIDEACGAPAGDFAAFLKNKKLYEYVAALRLEQEARIRRDCAFEVGREIGRNLKKHLGPD